MRNLKRTLSLVLAAMMLISMMVVGASAASKDFTDKDEITHTEAVSAMTTLNVIAGKGDGSYFDPTGTLTRAEMAKLVTYILNGGVEPVLGEKVTPTYKDIDGHWAEKYIEYCTSMNIIAGDGTGKFNPEGTLTAEQCAKMLLTAMNYKDDIFGFLGNNWAINVNREANAAGLYKELGGLKATDAISRDDAAQMVYNAIQAKTMKLSWTQDKETGEISQHYDLTGPSLFSDKFDGVVYEGVLRASGSMSGYVGVSAGKEKLNVYVSYINGDRPTGGSYSQTLNYPADVTNLVGEYVKVLYNAKDKVAYGVYSVASENNIVINTTIGALSNVGTPTADTLKYDGTTYDVDAGANAYLIRSDATVVSLAITDLDTDVRVANYDNVKLVDNDGDDKIDVAIVIENQVEQVTYVGSDSITLTNKGQVKAADAHYSDLAVDNYVSYTSTAANYDGKLAVTKASVVSGEVTEVALNTSSQVNKVKVDGEWYTLGQVNGSAPTNDGTNPLAYKVSYDLYLVNGYAAVAEKLKGNNIKVAVVTGTTGATDYDGNVQARLLLADGTTAEGYVDIAVTTGDFIAYTVEGNVYKSVHVGSAPAKALAGYDHYDSNTGLAGNAFNSTTSLVDGTSVDKKVNKDAVVFVHYDKDSATAGMQDAFMVITGATLNSWKSNWGDKVEFLYNDAGLGYADVVYVEGGINAVIPGIKSNYGYITSAVTEGQDANGVYSSFTIWDGTESRNVIARKSIGALGAGKGDAIKFEWDGDNVVKYVTPITSTAALIYSNGEQVKLVDAATSNGYDLADDVTIINVSTKDYAGVAGNAIATAAQTLNTGVYNFNCWYVYDAVDQEIDVLIIDVTSNALVNTGAGTTYDLVP